MGAPEDDLRVAEPRPGVERLIIAEDIGRPPRCSAAVFRKVKVGAIGRVRNQRVDMLRSGAMTCASPRYSVMRSPICTQGACRRARWRARCARWRSVALA